MTQQILYLLGLVVLLQAVHASVNYHLVQQQVVFACAVCCARLHSRRNKALKRRSPQVYVKARSTAWTDIVLRPDLFEETRFRFFFRVTRTRFESILQGVGPQLTGQDSTFKKAVCIPESKTFSSQAHIFRTQPFAGEARSQSLDWALASCPW
jgi:hypothetical protein